MRTRTLITAGLLSAGALAAPSVASDGSTTPAVALAPPDLAATVVHSGERLDVRVPGVPRTGTAVAAGELSAASLPASLASDVLAMAEPATTAIGGVHVVGDLDGDGRADRLEVAQPASAPVTAAAVQTVSYTAYRDSRDDVLWTLTAPGQVGVPLPVDTGDTGLVLATVGVTGTALAQRTTLDLRGVSPTGEVSWQRADTGTFATSAYQDFPLLRQPVELASGREAVHVELLDWVFGGTPPYPSPGAADVLLIDSGTGELVGRPATAGEGLTLSWPAGDLDGDGDGDIVFTAATDFEGGAPGRLSAVSSRGTLLWNLFGAHVVSLQSWVAAVGDVDGDGADDVAVGDGSSGFGDDANVGVAVFSGGDRGAVLWARPGEFPMAAGDLDGDGRPEVLIRSFVLAAGPQEFRLQLDAVRPDGTTLFRSREVHELPGRKSFGATTLIYLLGDDLDGDGAPDPRHSGFFEVDEVPTDVSGAFSGRDGRRLFLGSAGTVVRGGLTPGGADIVRVQPVGDGSTVQLNAVDGADGRTLWDRSVSLDSPVVDRGLFGLSDPAVLVSAGDVDGDGVRDLAVTFEVRDSVASTSQRRLVLSGSDGTPLRR